MNKLPIFVLQLIQNYGKTKEQVNLRSISKNTGNLQITYLDGYFRYKIIDSIVLKHKDSLIYLDANSNVNITDKSISQLHKLRILNASNNPNITDKGIINLKSISQLYAAFNNNITDECIISLIPNLRELTIRSNPCITNRSIKQLKLLKTLSISHNMKIDDTSIRELTNLEALYIHDCPVSDVGIKKLINLRKLIIKNTPNITNLGLKELLMRNDNLMHLESTDNRHITIKIEIKDDKRITTEQV